jgi:hypothetical protein
VPAPTPPTIRVEFRGGPYAGETRDMCEPLRDHIVALDPTSPPSVAFAPLNPDPVTAELVEVRQIIYRLESYYNAATWEVGHVYVAEPAPQPTRRDRFRATVLEWAELIALAEAYEAGPTKTGPPCQACGSPLGNSPSDDFCDAACQRAFHATGAEPLDESVPDGWPTWADPVPYGDHTIRADECVEGQRRARVADRGVDMLDAIAYAFDIPTEWIATSGDRVEINLTASVEGVAVTIPGLIAQLHAVQAASLDHLRDTVAGFSAAHNREGGPCPATPDAAANPESSTDTPSTPTDAPPEASPT